jgi:predicted nucleic acid-binding protein
MMTPLLVDTDVMVEFLRGNPKAVALIKRYSARVILSSIVVAELYAGVRGDEELSKLDGLISIFIVRVGRSGFRRTRKSRRSLQEGPCKEPWCRFS